MMRLTLHRNELVRGAITFFRPQGVESLVQKHQALEVEAIVQVGDHGSCHTVPVPDACPIR